MQEVNGKETIEVLVDNEIAVQNVTKMASSAGAKVTSEKTAEKEFKITILMNGAKESEEETVCVPDQRENTVIVINSDRMGNGNDELGKVLIKGFLLLSHSLKNCQRQCCFTTVEPHSLRKAQIHSKI